MDKRKDLIRAYKEKDKPTAGVFGFRNLKNGKVLIGSNLNLESMANRLRFSLDHGVYEIKELQADWNSYGPDNFRYEILDVLKPTDPPQPDPWKELKLLESLWLEKLQPYGEKGYNQPSAGN